MASGASRRVGIVGLTMVVVGLIGGDLPGFASSETDQSSEQRSFDLLNQERSERGKRELRWNDDLARVARNHSEDMAASGELEHNSRLGDQVDNWSELAENVGRGNSVTSIHNAFMNSDGHRANILGSFVEVGIGAVKDGEEVWVTQVFRTPSEPERTVRRARATRSVSTPRTTTYRSVAPALPLPPPVQKVIVRAQPQNVVMLERLGADYEGPLLTGACRRDRVGGC